MGLYELVNVFNADKKWLGQFINEQTAKDWIKKSGYDINTMTITRERPAWKRGA